MRLLVGSVFVAASLFACAASDSVVVVSGDGGAGAGDGAVITCTVEPDADRVKLCGSVTNSMLLTCKGGPAPSAACTKGASKSLPCICN